MEVHPHLFFFLTCAALAIVLAALHLPPAHAKAWAYVFAGLALWFGASALGVLDKLPDSGTIKPSSHGECSNTAFEVVQLTARRQQ